MAISGSSDRVAASASTRRAPTSLALRPKVAGDCGQSSAHAMVVKLRLALEQQGNNPLTSAAPGGAGLDLITVFRRRQEEVDPSGRRPQYGCRDLRRNRACRRHRSPLPQSRRGRPPGVAVPISDRHCRRLSFVSNARIARMLALGATLIWRAWATMAPATEVPADMPYRWNREHYSGPFIWTAPHLSNQLTPPSNVLVALLRLRSHCEGGDASAMKATIFDSDCISRMIRPTSSLESLVSDSRMR